MGPDFTDNLKMLAPMGLIVSFNALGGLPEKDLFKEMRAHLPKSPGVRCFTMHSFDRDPETRSRIMRETIALVRTAGKVKPPVFARPELSEARARASNCSTRAPCSAN